MDSNTARLETFSDGVFAIAATLLILEVNIPHPLHQSLGQELLDLWPSYLAYATSFITIGIIWVNHHAIFQLIERTDRTLLFVNTFFLLDIAFIPFPTKLVAEFLRSPDERDAVLAYDLTLLLMALLFQVLWFYPSRGRRLIAADAPRERLDAITRAFLPGVPLYLTIVAVAFVSATASVVLTLAAAIFYVPSEWLTRRREPPS
jgi:uncharacterized membrane protein